MSDFLNQIWDAMPASVWAANALLAAVFLLIGGLIFNWVPAWLKYRRSVSSDFSGEWENILYTPNNAVAKRDTLTVYQRGATVYGTISRNEPVTETNRRFEFRGQIKADRFVATYWAVDETINRAGSWHVRLVNDGYYSGLYVTVTPDNRIVAKRLDFRRKSSDAPPWLDEYHSRLTADLPNQRDLPVLEAVGDKR
ncbi:MAG: hypothetical protein AAF231_12190, partial [Pseudomonadota bacterium]